MDDDGWGGDGFDLPGAHGDADPDPADLRIEGRGAGSLFEIERTGPRKGRAAPPL